MYNIDSDTGAACTRLDDKRQIVTKFGKRRILSLSREGSSPRGRHTGHLKNLLCHQLIHGQGASKGIRSGVTDAENVKSGLKFAVLPDGTVKPHESNVRHLAELNYIGTNQAVRLVRTGLLKRL